MSIRTIGPERHDDIWLIAPQVPRDSSGGLARVCVVELLVVVVEQRDGAHAQHRRSGAEFRFADPGESQRARMFMVGGTVAVITATVATRGCQQGDIHAFGGVFGEHPSNAE